MRCRDYLVSLVPFFLLPKPLFREITHPTVFYLTVATSTMNSATEQPYAEVLNMIQFVSEREYLEAVCEEWSDYAETEDHQDNEHDKTTKQHNSEEDSRRMKSKTTPSLMGWLQDVYAYFYNMSLPSSTLVSTDEMNDSSPRQ